MSPSSNPIAKDFTSYPKLRHNLWTTPADSPDITYLTLSDGVYQVPTEEARAFFPIRSHCTGHNAVDEIAHRSGRSVEEVRRSLASLVAIGAQHRSIVPLETLSDAEIRGKLLAACKIWAEQLAETNIANEIDAGSVTRETAVGWMLENYHYVRAFPAAIAFAAERASGELRELLLRYAREETGHEAFMARCLEQMGYSHVEIDSSIPLVSTRTIDMLMRGLFALDPRTVLFVSRIIEATEYEEEQGKEFALNVARNYDFPADTLAPFIEHIRVDASLGHGRLLEDHTDLLDGLDRRHVHPIVNGLHDLKHAFDLQKLEIKNYYSNTGNYVPRQFVSFFAI